MEQVLTDWQSQTRPSLRLTISLVLQSLSIKIYSKSLFLLISVVHDNIFELDQWFHLHVTCWPPCGLEEPLAHWLLISRCYEVSRDLVHTCPYLSILVHTLYEVSRDLVQHHQQHQLLDTVGAKCAGIRPYYTAPPEHKLLPEICAGGNWRTISQGWGL